MVKSFNKEKILFRMVERYKAGQLDPSDGDHLSYLLGVCDALDIPKPDRHELEHEFYKHLEGE